MAETPPRSDTSTEQAPSSKICKSSRPPGNLNFPPRCNAACLGGLYNILHYQVVHSAHSRHTRLRYGRDCAPQSAGPSASGNPKPSTLNPQSHTLNWTTSWTSLSASKNRLQYPRGAEMPAPSRQSPSRADPTQRAHTASMCQYVNVSMCQSDRVQGPVGIFASFWVPCACCTCLIPEDVCIIGRLHCMLGALLPPAVPLRRSRRP